MKDFALDEQVFNPLHSTAHDRLHNSLREPELEVGATLSPVLQRHEELVRKRELCRASWLDFPLPMLPEDIQHLLEGLRLNTACALEILRLQVLDLFVGHRRAAHDLLLPPSPDFCKRSTHWSSRSRTDKDQTKGSEQRGNHREAS
jgi:hypothetical protein